MANFDIAYNITSQIESGYSNISSDKGGETYCGISRINNPGFVGWSIIDQRNKIKQLQRGEFICDNRLDKLVKEFYKQNYWNKNRLGDIINQDIANEIYDIGVNMGTGFAAYVLQDSLNLLNRNQRDYPDIKEDMLIGNITLGLVNNFNNISAILKTINGLRFIKYEKICKSDPTQEENFIGWLTRINF